MVLFLDETSNDFCRVQHNHEPSRFDISTKDEESLENERDNDIILSPMPTQSIEKSSSVHPIIMSKHIEGVKFITTEEMKLIDAQRDKYPLISWFTQDKQKQVNPIRHWFTKEHQWLRAVCTENRYGVVCVDCAEYATGKALIERNNGAFILRPYWKLKHKGLDGVIRFL